MYYGFPSEIVLCTLIKAITLLGNGFFVIRPRFTLRKFVLLLNLRSTLFTAPSPRVYIAIANTIRHTISGCLIGTARFQALLFQQCFAWNISFHLLNFNLKKTSRRIK